MKKWLLGFICVLHVSIAAAQEINYHDSLKSFRDKYIREHEVVLDKDRSGLRFFPIDEDFSVSSRVELIDESPWFTMQTSGTKEKVYRVYAILHFRIKGKALKLQVLQARDLLTNPAYADYLLIAFTDKTSGEDTYENGRYIDATTAQMNSGTYQLDFNRAYNPYCAYVSNKYNCPLPPKENQLPVEIRAGEMKYSKDH